MINRTIFAKIFFCVLILTSFFGSMVLFGQARNVDSFNDIQSAAADLVLYLPMDEGTGNMVSDHSGKGNDGTIYGASWTTGILGSALEFDGRDDYVEILNTDILNSQNALTISCWVRVKSSSLLRYFVMTNGFALFQEGVNMGLAISVPLTHNAQGSINLNQWEYITGTFDGTNIKFYINGQLQETRNWPGTMTTGSLQLVFGYFNSEYWTGAIDEVCIQNRVLSAEEIENNFALTQCVSVPSLSAVFFALFTLTGVMVLYKRRK